MWLRVKGHSIAGHVTQHAAYYFNAHNDRRQFVADPKNPLGADLRRIADSKQEPKPLSQGNARSRLTSPQTFVELLLTEARKAAAKGLYTYTECIGKAGFIYRGMWPFRTLQVSYINLGTSDIGVAAFDGYIHEVIRMSW